MNGTVDAIIDILMTESAWIDVNTLSQRLGYSLMKTSLIVNFLASYNFVYTRSTKKGGLSIIEVTLHPSTRDFCKTIKDLEQCTIGF